jgi:hypothetical protein
VVLPETADLTEVGPELLAPGELPGLWAEPVRTVAEIKAYFAGGAVVHVERQGYTEPVTVPRVMPDVVEAAILRAVEKGFLWLRAGPASVLAEPVPVGVLADTSTLQAPPPPIAPTDLVPDALPSAWSAGETTALSVASALSARAGQNLPWTSVRTAIDAALRMRVLERTIDSGPWPVDLPGAGVVKLRVPEKIGATSTVRPSPGVLQAEAELEASQVQDLADVVADVVKTAAGCDLRFIVRVELGAEDMPPEDAVDEINGLLMSVDENFGPLT